MFGLAKVTTSSKFNQNMINYLDNKKMTVVGLTTATAGISMALAVVPGDATTPIANQILKLTSWLAIITGAVFLEKILITLSGYVAFKILIPIACLLFIIYLLIKNKTAKSIGIKLTIFAIIFWLTIPASIEVSNLIENSYHDTINQAITSVDKIDENDAEENQSNENESFGEKFKNAMNSLGNETKKLLAKGEKVLSNLIDAIAILIITSCIIPILVFLFFIWIIKLIFGIDLKNTKIEQGVNQLQDKIVIKNGNKNEVAEEKNDNIEVREIKKSN